MTIKDILEELKGKSWSISPAFADNSFYIFDEKAFDEWLKQKLIALVDDVPECDYLYSQMGQAGYKEDIKRWKQSKKKGL